MRSLATIVAAVTLASPVWADTNARVVSRAVLRAISTAAAQDGPLIDGANIRVRTDANGYLIVASQTYAAPDGPLRPLANTLVRTDANGYLIVTNPAGLGGNHAILSSTHTDTTAATVVRGDVLTGQGATPSWRRLALGASGTIPRSDGTDLGYSTFTIPSTVADKRVPFATAANVYGTHQGFTIDEISTNYFELLLGNEQVYTGVAGDIGGSLIMWDNPTGLSSYLSLSGAGNDFAEFTHQGTTGNSSTLLAFPNAFWFRAGAASTGGVTFLTQANAPIRFGTGGFALTNLRLQIEGDGSAITVVSPATATEFRLREPSGSGTNYTGFIAPILAGNLVYTLPATDGAANAFLQTDGALGTSWSAVDLAASDVTGDLPFSNLAQGGALSVLGVTGNAVADVASIAAGADNQVLRRSGTALAFGAVNIASTDAVTGALAVGNGGSGGATFTDAGVLLGNGISAFQVTTAGTSGQVLTSNGAGVDPTFQAAAGGGTPTSETTTLTGTQNNFDLDARFTYLRCNNATPLVLTGFTVTGSAPSAGDRVIIHHVGTSTVRVADQDTGSTAGNRANHVTARGQIVGADGTIQYVYDGTNSEWKFISVEPGAFITVAYAGTDFTTNSADTWTVESGDLLRFAYQQRGTIISLILSIDGSSLSAANSSRLRAALPNSFTTAAPLTGMVLQYSHPGSTSLGTLRGSVAGETYISFRDATGGNWSAGTNNIEIYGTFHMEVQ